MEPAFRDHKDIDTWWPGDWVSVWNQDQSELRGMSRLNEAEDVVGENRFYLTLESLPEGTQPDDTFIYEELLNRNTLISNCRSSDLRLNGVKWSSSPDPFLRVGPDSEVWISQDSRVDDTPFRADDDGIRNRVEIHPTGELHFETP